MSKGTHLARKRKFSRRPIPWNKGKQVGQKLPLSLQQIRSIRSRLKKDQQVRELALFNLAVDSSLKPFDLIRLRVGDIAKGRRPLTKVSITAPVSKRRSSFVLGVQTRATCWRLDRTSGAQGKRLSVSVAVTRIAVFVGSAVRKTR